ncbi:MAG: efflux RND transporter periplasmic adaptor subunit [Kofleriaceae bacterium]|nr:efflux RND transporter periplasmic adaptor subunit [Kofleriaceae bacterium]
MKRVRTIKLAIALGIVAAVIALAGPYLVSWFTGTPAGGGDTSKMTRASAGALAIDAALRPDPPREKGNTLALRVLDANGKPIEHAEVEVTYVMPAMGSMPEMRGTASISTLGQGRYEARFDLPMGGSWTLEVRINAGTVSGSARFQMTVGTSGLAALGGSRTAGTPAFDKPTLPAFALPAPALEAVRRAFDATERVRADLAADRLDGLAAPARETAQALRATQATLANAPAEIVDCIRQAVGAAERLAGATDLEAARRSFGDLNRLLIALAAADPRLQESWHVFRCPMAEGFKEWIQRSPALENPYMGQSMPTCGGSTTWGSAHTEDVGVSHEGHGHEGDDVSFYTCPMHPSVREKRPGKCPICAMDLSDVTYDEEESGVIFVDEARRAQIGVRTSKVVRTPMTRSIRAIGRIAYDETTLEDVTLKLAGFISKLHVAETGQPVRKGQLLFTLYSPELFAAQQEYLLARESHAEAGSGRGEYLVRAAAKKLELWGLARAQRDALDKRGKPLEDVPFYSPASGYVIEKNVVEGAAVEVGQRLFRIAALDRVWVEADVYEADLALIAKGMRAVVTLSYLPGKTYEGKVAYVYPYLDPASRTGKVRIELPNTGLELKPEMYATVAFQVELGPRLQIPIGAVVYTGPRRLVFLDIGEGRLRPQEVTLGTRNEDAVEVVGGLREGQTIVTSGNFLVAAESRIRSSAKFWTEERAGQQDAGTRSAP